MRPGDVVYVPGQATRRKVCVLGQVKVAGLYTLSPHMTVVEALTAAGWVEPSGVLNSVIVARRGSGGDHGDQKFFRVDARRVITQRDWSQDLPLQPGDIVYVPEHFVAKLGEFVGFFTARVEPVAHTYLRVYDATNPASYLVDR